MRATLILCDYADSANGKLYVTGAGWTHIMAAGTPAAMSLAVLIHVPWDRTNQRHTFVLRLLNNDGASVQSNDQDVQAVGEFEVGRPPGLKAGSELNTPATFRFEALILDEGGYVWELQVDDEQLARSPFFVVKPPT